MAIEKQTLKEHIETNNIRNILVNTILEVDGVEKTIFDVYNHIPKIGQITVEFTNGDVQIMNYRDELKFVVDQPRTKKNPNKGRIK